MNLSRIGSAPLVFAPAAFSVFMMCPLVADAAPLATKTEVVVSKLKPSASGQLHPSFRRTPSANGKRLAYHVQDNGAKKTFVVADGVVGKAYDFVDLLSETVLFSPDEKYLAYTAHIGKKVLVVRDGRESPLYDAIDEDPRFGAEGRMAYRVRRGKQFFIVVDDGTKTQEHPAQSVGYIPETKRQFTVQPVKGSTKGRGILDGKPGPEYDEIYTQRWSGDEKHFAYSARRGKQWFVVRDGKEEAAYDYIGDDSARSDGRSEIEDLDYSPDNLHLAYVARRGGKSFVVLDGKPGTPYDEIGIEGPYERFPSWRVFFSSDSAHLAYSARRGKQWSIVLDGKEGAPFDAIHQVHFSPDARHLAYVAERNGKRLVVRDGKEESEYSIIGETEEKRNFDDPRFKTGDLAWSPDSLHLAYVAQRDKKWMVVVDGREGAQWANVRQPLWSADSRRIAYVAIRGDKRIAVVDEKPGKEYLSIMGLTFSPDGRRVAYKTHVSDGKGGVSSIAVIDGQESAPYTGIEEEPFVWSPGGRQVYFKAWRGPEKLLVLDNKEIRGVYKTPIWSADGNHVAYAIGRDKKIVVLRDGKEGPAFDNVARLTFSPDGRYLAYWAVRNDKWQLAVNESEVAASDYWYYDFAPEQLDFASPNRFRTLAIRDAKVLWIDVTIDDK